MRKTKFHDKMMTYESVENRVRLYCRKSELATYTKLQKMKIVSKAKMSKIGLCSKITFFFYI